MKTTENFLWFFFFFNAPGRSDLMRYLQAAILFRYHPVITETIVFIGI